MKHETTINPRIRTEMVEVNVAANNSNNTHNFGQLPNLRLATKIISIEAYHVDQVAKSLTNKTLISESALKNCYLELVELSGSQAKIHTFPLWDLNQNTNSVLLEKINCQAIDFEKSLIQVPDGPNAGINVNESFLFKIRYEKAGSN